MLDGLKRAFFIRPSFTTQGFISRTEALGQGRGIGRSIALGQMIARTHVPQAQPAATVARPAPDTRWTIGRR